MNYYICISCGALYHVRGKYIICGKCGGVLKKITKEEYYSEKKETILE